MPRKQSIVTEETIAADIELLNSFVDEFTALTATTTGQLDLLFKQSCLHLYIRWARRVGRTAKKKSKIRKAYIISCIHHCARSHVAFISFRGVNVMFLCQRFDIKVKAMMAFIRLHKL